MAHSASRSAYHKSKMSPQLFTGKLTRLVAYDPDRAAELHAQWYRDSEFSRNYDFPPVRPRDAKRTQERFRQHAAQLNPDSISFQIQALDSEQIIGECELERMRESLHDAYVSIGIGERAYWGRGFGTDAMRLMLAFGFNEWNLHRITLSVFGYNARAIRSYEKAGFVMEGRMRQRLKRDGKRWDDVTMGFLRADWEQASRAL